jgi:hypothetical protein
MSASIRNDVALLGMIHYKLIGDGGLNGVWTNTDKRSDILLNEIARKTDEPRGQLAGT